MSSRCGMIRDSYVENCCLCLFIHVQGISQVRKVRSNGKCYLKKSLAVQSSV